MMRRAGWLALLWIGCANNPVVPREGDGGSPDAAGTAMDAGDDPRDAGEARDAGPGDAGPPRTCAEGCAPLERCVDGLCAPYPPCGGDGSCPAGAVCQRRLCLPEGEDLDGDGSAAPDDCDEGDPAIHPDADEVCNGADEDCDGASDEDVAPRACSTACGAGTETCTGGAFGGCTAPMPATETCDDVDDDCDGRVDEGLTRGCSTACGSGNETCSRGAWTGCTARAPATEACNAVDDDCDGTVDGMTRACSTACGSGLETCRTGAYGGCTAPPVIVETCNLADDDCNLVCDDASGGCRAPVHRSYSAGSGEHFYTTSRPEAACCGFTVEHFDYFHLYRAAAPGLVAFHRCVLSSGFHFYTTSATCEGAPGSILEGVMGYLSPSAVCGSTPLYRLVRGDDHFYAASAAERDAALADGYIGEGVAGHVWLTP